MGRLAKLTAGYAVMGGVAAVVGGFVALGAVWLLTRVIMPWWVHDLGMRQTGAAFDPAVLTEPWIYTAADTLMGSPSVLRVAAAAVVAGALCVAVWQTLEAGPDEVDRAGSPRASFRADRGLMLVRVALVLAATTAVVVGLFGRAWRWGAAELGTALANAGGITPETARSWNAVALGSDRFTAPVLAVSLAVAAFSTVIVSAWFGFQVGVLYRAARRQTPRAVFDFLDDAHRRGVLRREGAVYEFRHRLVHHYLADPSTAARPVEDVLREARALAGSGKRRRAAALLSTITTVTSEAYVRLAELHEDWSYRFRDPVRQFWYWKHFDLSVRYWKLAIDNGYPEAVELAAAMYSRQLRRCGRSLIGSFYKMTLHDRAREFWAGEAEFANPATRAALLEIMEDHLRDRERFAWLRMQQATLRRRVNKVRDLPDGAPVRDRNWWASVVLGDTAERALRSASIGAQGGALQTGAVFAALARVDAHNSSAWADFWLHTNYPDPADLERVKDTSAESSLPPLPIGRSGYSLIPSVDLRAALERLAELVVTERLDHVPPGVLALALTSVPEAGATRLLCAMGRTDADMLRRLVRQHLC
ncbi:hypothetical protein ACFQV2_13230 [Actinokineospora soli]|uniref:Uncharacterized protein n=1 Tax=Actinokineospora soli TaxID=1048753 RepID=A0ABW2TN23_9PSEU